MKQLKKLFTIVDRIPADALAVIGIRLKTVFDTSVFNCHLTKIPLEKRENLNTVLQKFQCQFKGRIRDYDSNPSFWKSRPLSRKQIESASDDVINLFDLKEKMVETLSRKKVTEKEMHLIYSSSNQAVDEYRSLVYSEIVPVPTNMKGAIIGQSGTTIVSIQRKTKCVITAYIGRSEGYLVLADNMGNLMAAKNEIFCLAFPILSLLKDLRDATTTHGSTILWNRVFKVLTHDDWYSEEELKEIRLVASTSTGLTPKQRGTVYSVKPQRQEDDYDSDD